MDWTRGYQCSWKAYEVDLDTWADGTPIRGVKSASVERDVTDDSPLIESGTLTMDAPIGSSFGERYVRIVMVAEQAGGKARVEVATLLCAASSGTVDRMVDDKELRGRSVLWPAYTTKIRRGLYVPKGADGAEWCRALLAETIQAPVVCTAQFAVEDYFVIEPGTSVLDAVWMVLKAGGCVLTIYGNGTVHVRKLPEEPALTLDRVNAKLLTPGVSHELDWSEVPNRYFAVEGDEVAVATNTWRSSPTSTVTRGYFNDVWDTSPVRVDGETLLAYAKRKLEELSTIPDSRTYTREWWPGVHPFTLVEGTIPSTGIEGIFRVERQSYECGHGIRVTEQASMEVKAWHR